MDGGGQNELVVGLQDFRVRVLRPDGDLMFELTQTEAVVSLCALGPKLFAFGLDSGAVGVYRAQKLLWKIKVVYTVVTVFFCSFYYVAYFFELALLGIFPFLCAARSAELERGRRFTSSNFVLPHRPSHRLPRSWATMLRAICTWPLVGAMVVWSSTTAGWLVFTCLLRCFSRCLCLNAFLTCWVWDAAMGMSYFGTLFPAPLPAWCRCVDTSTGVTVLIPCALRAITGLMATSCC